MNDTEIEVFIQTLKNNIETDNIGLRINNIRVREVYDALVEVDNRDIDLYEDARNALSEYERLYLNHVMHQIEVENLFSKITYIITRIKKNKISKFPPGYRYISLATTMIMYQSLLLETERIKVNIKSISNILLNNTNILSAVGSEYVLPILAFKDTWTDHLSLLLNYLKGKSIFTKKIIIDLQDEHMWENRFENNKKLLLQGPSKTPTSTPTPFYSQSYQLVNTNKYTPMPSVPYKVSIEGIPKESVKITNEILAKSIELLKTSVVDTVGIISSGISFGFTNLMLPYTPGEKKIITKDLERIDATIDDISDNLHRIVFKTMLLCAFYIFFYVLLSLIYYIKIKFTNRKRARITTNFSFSHNKLSSRKLRNRKLSSRKLSSHKLSSHKLSSRKLSSRKLSSHKLSSRKLSSRKLSSRKLSSRKLSSRKPSNRKLSSRTRV